MGRCALSALEKADRAACERIRGRQRRMDARQNSQTNRSDPHPHNANSVPSAPTSGLPVRVTIGINAVPDNGRECHALTLDLIDEQRSTSAAPRRRSQTPAANQSIVTMYEPIVQVDETGLPPNISTRSIDERTYHDRICVAAQHSEATSHQDAVIVLNQAESITPAQASSLMSPTQDGQQALSRPGYPQKDPALSPPSLTRLRVQRYRDQQHLTRAQPIVQQFEDTQELPPTVEFSTLTLHVGPVSSSFLLDEVQPGPNHVSDNESDPELGAEPILFPLSPNHLPAYVDEDKDEDGGNDGDDASESFGLDDGAVPCPSTSALPSSPSSSRHDGQPPQRRSSLPSILSSPVSFDSITSSSSSSPSVGSDDPILGGYLQAIHNQDIAGGPDFLRTQGGVYDRILGASFNHRCNCSSSRERAEPENTHTLQEHIQHISRSLPPLPTVFAERDQASLPHDSVTITRLWDVNSLSLERFRDLYDEIILPAVRETVLDHMRQEIPGSYDLIYAKSRAYQEKPAYGIPASILLQFWAAVVRNANLHCVQSKRGDAVPYFQNPRLLFQAHDLKNIFASQSLQESLALFRDTVLASLDPTQIDMHSCWLDVGMGDHVHTPPPSPAGQSPTHCEPWTLPWKSDCCRHLHDQVLGVTPEAPMEATHYRPHLLRDVGAYYAKAKLTRNSNPGHPEARSPGVIRAKAYNCNQSRQRAFISQLNRSRLLDAWDANKRHIRAISSSKRHSNFGIRKEVTFWLDVILAMWAGGRLEPSQNPHTGPMCWEVPLAPSSISPLPPIVSEQQHCPFWVIPTEMLTAFVSTQAARFVLPLDHIFSEITRASSSADHPTSLPDPAQQILAFHTAQLFCRLLIHAVSSEREYSFDYWIWRSAWQVKDRSRRNGRRSGRMPHCHFDWQRDHISPELLVNLYISRSPLQAKLAHRTNVQALATSQFEMRGPSMIKGITRMQRVLLTGPSLLRLKRPPGLIISTFLPSFTRTETDSEQAQEESEAETARIPTAQTVHGIYAEAWAKYRQVTADDGNDGDINASSSQSPPLRSTLPEELPCWMNTRRRLPPKNSWHGFLFDQIFCRLKPPTWNALLFLQLYRGFKEVWQGTCAPLGPFDSRFSRQIGYYIQIAFNSDNTKEVGTSHACGTWYHAKPTFFQIQYRAPYFSPPRAQEKTSLSSFYHRRTYPKGLSPRSTPSIPSPRRFHDLERAAWPHWAEIMHHLHDDLDHLPPERRNSIRRHCKLALLYISYLAGPTWGLDKDDINFIVPWSINKISRGSSNKWGIFYLPVAETHIPEAIFEDTREPPERDIEPVDEEDEEEAEERAEEDDSSSGGDDDDDDDLEEAGSIDSGSSIVLTGRA
ncbi:hypothetical protein B0T10DRAFT_594976 [Thelonectria olida]|uniref:Uncharacterized protein n=1 Tax=Thelonectria olida TaxID=1576542 RepID=A0A9P9AHM4_9HYPO|nr:hypothetical protein B0T10DRAFT_594976 [Thelonectria olida]